MENKMLIQKYLLTHSYDDLEKEFGVIVNVYDDRVVLNYHQIDSYKHRFNPMVMECRALILRRSDHAVLCRSFDRFFNYGEDPNSDRFNVTKSVAYDKIDGSIMNVYHDGYKWCVSTRKMAFAEGEIPNKKRTYYDVFCDALDADPNDVFKDIDKNFTTIFEMVSPETRIVTPYKEPALYLLDVRDRNTGFHLGHKVAFFWKNDGGRWFYPQEYKFNSFDDIVHASKKLPAMEEGYVVCLDDWKIKVKNPAYLAIAHLRDNGAITEKRVVKLVFMQDHVEYLVHFPEDKPEFEPYIKAYREMIKDITISWTKYGAIEDQKDFAMKIIDKPCKGVLFAMKKGKKISEILDGFTDNYRTRLLRGYIKK
jgi:hypothetical protein